MMDHLSCEEAREEIRAAIIYYDERGLCWLSVVTFIGIKALFGSFSELLRSARRPWPTRKRVT